MGHVLRFVILMAFGGAMSACALLSGLDQISQGVDAPGADATIDAHPSSTGSDASGDVRHDTVTADTSVGVGEGDDGTVSADDSSIDMEEGGGGESAADGRPDGADDAGDGGGLDAGPDAYRLPDADSGPDAPPPCAPGNCSGCCDANRICLGGQSLTTCGTGGATCRNCASVSQSCNNGACSTVAPEAGPGCTPNPGLCAFVTICPFFYSACCKSSDGTCGCQLNSLPEAGPCR